MLKARSNSVSAVLFFTIPAKSVLRSKFRRFAVIGLVAERNVALG